MYSPHQILKKYWGFDDFLEPQEVIINKLLDGNNLCAFLPTGGGKSLCYQVPALCEKGICIVISPLVALMEDQVNNLSHKGISAVYLKAGMSYKEINRILDNCIYGNIKFLYLSAERLQQEIVQERIKQMNVNLFAIDEAHCISQWGHDFRPSYKKLKILTDLKPYVKTIAVTASATKLVQQDIIEQLQLANPVIIKRSLKRNNIGIYVEFANDKYHCLLGKFKQNKGAAIVYVRSRRATKELSAFLNQNNIKAAAYNGGLTDKERKKVLNDWITEKNEVVVATNAFGMGIDKPNVRQVIHFHLAESMESYFQEIGRCGRDGLPSKAITIYNKSDFKRLKSQFIDVIPQLKEVIEIYIKLNSFFSIAYGEGENTSHEFDMYLFCEKYKFNVNLVYNTLDLLERFGILVLNKTSFQKTTIQFACDQKQVFDFLSSYPQHASIIECILRTYGGIFDNFTPIDLNLIAHSANTTKKEVLNTLQELKRLKIINATIYVQDFSIFFLVPKENKRTIYKYAKEIEQYKIDKYVKAKAVVDFIKNTKQCRSIQVLEYFGEENNSSCLNCSVCLNEENETEKKIDYMAVSDFILSNLLKDELDVRSLIELKKYNRLQIIETLKKLLDQKKIKISDKNTYKLNNI